MDHDLDEEISSAIEQISRALEQNPSRSTLRRAIFQALNRCDVNEEYIRRLEKVERVFRALLEQGTQSHKPDKVQQGDAPEPT